MNRVVVRSQINPCMSETDNDGWQVAGRRKGRRRSKFAAGAPADRSSGCYPSQQSTVSCLTGTNRNQCVPRLIGFRYKNSAKHDNECAFEQRLAEEVRKIERIQELLKQSVFWERLEIGLQTTLSSLGLSARAARMESNTSTSQGSRQSETGVLHVETSTQIHARDGLIQAELPVVATASHSVTTSPTSLISSRVHHDGGGEQELSKCLLESYCRFDPSARDANAPEPISNGAPCGGCAGSDDGCEQCAGLYEIVCYGIGRFCESHNSRYQLALALCLRDMLLPCVGRSSGDVSPRHEELEEDIKRDMYQLDGSRPQLLMFDPVLGEFEKATLTRLGCQMIQENEKGKRSCCRPPESDQNEAQPSGCRRRPTLFFMPHCPRRLYSNLLWANWSHLGKIYSWS